MEARTYSIRDVKLLIPKIFRDHRGFFMEAYNQRTFTGLGIDCQFIQDNHSQSQKGTLRGLHYQINTEQAKLVRCLRGRIFDVAVDIRPGSPTYGQWVGEILDDENHHQLFVPRGFAHGFQVLSDTAEVLYKCDNWYSPKEERGIMWDDPDIGIQWPLKSAPVLSDKDKINPCIKDIIKDEVGAYVDEH